MGARSTTIAIALAAAATTHAQSARADGLAPDVAETPEPPPPPPAPPPAAAPPSPPPSASSHWYGGEILLVDLASDIAMISGTSAAFAGNDGAGGTLALFGAAGYFLGAPSVHVAHGRSAGIVVASLALRLLVPVAGFFVGDIVGTGVCSASMQSASNESSGFDDGSLGCVDAGLGGALIGFGVGMLTAQVLDAALLSTESTQSRRDASSAPAPLVLVAPTFGTLRDSERRTVPTLGVVVSF